MSSGDSRAKNAPCAWASSGRIGRITKTSPRALKIPLSSAGYGGSASLTGGDDWLGQLGVRQRQRRGLGQEFQQLREFRDGDTLRQIDWKATARKRMPIAREYQD